MLKSSVTVKQRRATFEVSQDEGIRPDTTLEAMGKLRPAFQADGTVTAANASGINDGASAMIVMSKEKAEALGLVYQATLVGYQEVGMDPNYMGYTPVPAINNCWLNKIKRLLILIYLKSMKLLQPQVLLFKTAQR